MGYINPAAKLVRRVQNSIFEPTAKVKAIKSTARAGLYYWPNWIHGWFTYRNLELQVSGSDICKFKMDVESSVDFSTHSMNRLHSHGPRLQFEFLDKQGREMPQVITSRQFNRSMGDDVFEVILEQHVEALFENVDNVFLCFSSYEATEYEYVNPD